MAELFEITQEHVDVIESAIKVARQYETMMGDKQRLGITGEVGDIKACFKYDLKLAKMTENPGYDAVDSEGKKVQIRTRRIVPGKTSIDSKRLSTFSKDKFDYCLLLMLDKEYDIEEVWRTEASALEPIIWQLTKRNPTITAFKRVGKLIYEKNASG